MGELQIRMLGPLEVLRDDAPVHLPPGRPIALLGMLLVHPGQVVPTDRLMEELWRGHPPPSAPHALQVYISNLRKLLEPGRGPREAGQILVTRPPGYTLVLPTEQCDAGQFELLLDQGYRALDDGRPADAARLLADALALWRGPVLADLGDEPFVAPEATRLEEVRSVATERWAEAELALGHHRELVSDLETAVRQNPFRERLWAHLIVALYRSGRASDALNAYQRFRTILAEELGLDPSPELRALEMAVLRHDPDLLLAGPPDAPAVTRRVAPGVAPLPPRLGRDPSWPFVGRLEERILLERAWKRAEQGTVQVVFVGGEPGIGKTRLATEVAVEAHDQGALVLFGSCDEDLAVPYQPFVEALRHLLTVCPDEDVASAVAGQGGELSRLLPELSRRLPETPAAQPADPDTERYLLFSAVAGLLGRLSVGRPSVLLLDDLHWATKGTLLLLKHVIRSDEPMALLIVATYRDSDIGRGDPLTELLADLRRESGIERINLRGLSIDESLAMMETLAGHDLEGRELALVHAVHEDADGSPFFMRELVQHFVETGDLVRQGDRWMLRAGLTGVGLPDSVREVIDQRLSRLPEPSGRLLALAAVVGRDFDVAVVAEAAGQARSTIVDSLEVAREAGLVREVTDAPGRYTFVHALIRDALYDGLGAARRLELHRVVGETLESLGPAGAYLSDLARHWAAAIPAVGAPAHDLAKAARYGEQAGRRAMASLAYEEAINHFGGALHAVRLTDDRSSVCELLIALGEAQRCAGDPRHRETLLDAGKLAHELGDHDRAARAALANQRGAYGRTGAYSKRVAALEAALDAVGRGASPVRARLLAALATETHFEGEHRLGLAREAVGIAREIGDDETLAQALAALWFAAWGSTAELERGSIARELATVAATSTDGPLRFQAGMCLFLSASAEGDMERADEALSTCLGLADELGQPLFRWRVNSLQVLRAMAAGRFDDAERLARESMTLGEAAGQPDRLPFLTTPLVTVRLLQGRPEEVEELVAPVIEQFPEIVGYLTLLAWALAEEGRTGEAKAIVDRLRADGFAGVPRDYVWLLSMASLSRAAARLGNSATAAELYDMLAPYGEAMITTQSSWIGPVPHDLALLAATLGRYDDAAQHFADAAEVQDRIGARGTVIHTRLEWARMLLSRGGPQDTLRARALLEAAEAAAVQAGLPALAARARALLEGPFR